MPNLLIEKRQRVAQLEAALTRAREQKRRADLRVTERVAQIADGKTKLPAGVIAQFEINPRVRPQATMQSAVGFNGLIVEVPVDGEAMAEKAAAREAHMAFCEADREYNSALADLTNFERELRNLQSRIDCLRDFVAA